VSLVVEFRLQMLDGRTKYVGMLDWEVEDGAGHPEYVSALMDVVMEKTPKRPCIVPGAIWPISHWASWRRLSLIPRQACAG